MARKQESGVGWERIAQVASEAFLRRGYTGVSLRDISGELGIKPASIYHHCPRGKEQLFEASLTWRLQQIRAALEAALARCGSAPFDACVRALVDVLMEQVFIDTARLVSVDLPALKTQATRERVSTELHHCLFGPFAEAARGQEGVREDLPPEVFAASLLASLTSVRAHLEQHQGQDQEHAEMARAMLDATVTLLIDGMRQQV